MSEGDIILLDLLQPDGSIKLRPALILKQLPKYNDFLICGISSQLHQYIQDYDEILSETNPDFHRTGLRKTSVIRLCFLAVVQEERIAGTIGNIKAPLHKALLERLAAFLVKQDFLKIKTKQYSPKFRPTV